MHVVQPFSLGTSDNSPLIQNPVTLDIIEPKLVVLVTKVAAVSGTLNVFQPLHAERCCGPVKSNDEMPWREKTGDNHPIGVMCLPLRGTGDCGL